MEKLSWMEGEVGGGAGTLFRPKGRAETWSVLSRVGAGEGLAGLAVEEGLSVHIQKTDPSAGVGDPRGS